MMKTRHTFVRWSILIVLAVLALVGCSTATTTVDSRPVTSGVTSSSAPATNGLEHRTPAQIQQAAIDALRKANSFRIVGTIGTIDSSKPGPFDERIEGFSSDTTTIVDGGHLEFLLTNGTLYVKADRKGNQLMGMPSEVLDQVSDKWIASGAVTGTPTMVGYSVDTVIAWLRHDPAALMGTVERDTVNGKPVVMITTKYDDRLYVADTGTPYPVRIVTATTGPLDFSEFGTNFHITVPTDTISGIPG